MDSLVSLVDQVIPGSPLLAIITAVLLLAAGWIARKAAASMRRQGARLGTVEKVVKLERARRRQVEQCLREDGIPFVALTSLGGGAGISLNTPNGKETLPRSSSTPAPAPARAAAPTPRPAPVSAS
jgi:hypothetical protein